MYNYLPNYFLSSSLSSSLKDQQLPTIVTTTFKEILIKSPQTIINHKNKINETNERYPQETTKKPRATKTRSTSERHSNKSLQLHLPAPKILFHAELPLKRSVTPLALRRRASIIIAQSRAPVKATRHLNDTQRLQSGGAETLASTCIHKPRIAIIGSRCDETRRLQAFIRM